MTMPKNRDGRFGGDAVEVVGSEWMVRSGWM